MTTAQKSRAVRVAGIVRVGRAIKKLIAKPSPIRQSEQLLEEIEEQREQLAAELIIVQIPTQVKITLADGRSHAEIMHLNPKGHGDAYYAGPNVGIRSPSWLRGVAKIVYDSCEAAGLKPCLRRFKNGEDVDVKIVLPLGCGKPRREMYE